MASFLLLPYPIIFAHAHIPNIGREYTPININIYKMVWSSMVKELDDVFRYESIKVTPNF